MNSEPKDGKEALYQMFELMRNAAADEGCPLTSECTEKFEVENLRAFEGAFKGGKWKNAEAALRMVAGVHGRLSAFTALKAGYSEVPLTVFAEVGHRIRQHCPPLSKGDWCAWP
jgi:hypothetical protein